MFSPLVIFYLFLGGSSAGTVATCCVVDILQFLRTREVDHRCCTGIPHPETGSSPVKRTLDTAFVWGLLMIAAGVGYLMADLGRVDRLSALFFDPHPTVLTLGAYSLAIMAILAAFLACARWLYLPSIPRRLVLAVEAMTVPVTVVMAAYTGVLLQSLIGVSFWRSALIPVLFVLSSASCGMSCFCLASIFAGEPDQYQKALMRRLARWDMTVIALEAACATAFLIAAAESTNPGTQTAFRSIISGETAAAWWLGFVACGMAAPFTIEVLLCINCKIRRSGRPTAITSNERTLVALTAILVLVGALSMRWALVESGVQRAPELQDVPAATLTLGEADDGTSSQISGQINPNKTPAPLIARPLVMQFMTDGKNNHPLLVESR